MYNLIKSNSTNILFKYSIVLFSSNSSSINKGIISKNLLHNKLILNILNLYENFINSFILVKYCNKLFKIVLAFSLSLNNNLNCVINILKIALFLFMYK